MLRLLNRLKDQHAEQTEKQNVLVKMVYLFLIDEKFSSIFGNSEYFVVEGPALYLTPEPNNNITANCGF